MRWLGATAVVALLGAAALAGAQGSAPAPKRTELMVLTGPESGVYFAIGHDIKRLLDEVVPEAGVALAVVPSQGALQNVVDVFRYGSFQLAITQTDVLAYLELYARGDPAARRVMGGLQVVGRLYEEDVYLFARPGITGLADLAGKSVDIGPAGSGATVTSLVLMHLAGVEPRELVNYAETSEAVTALRRGRIDAFFRVVATPANYLQESVSASHGFVLVPIRLSPRPEGQPLAQYYAPSVIPAHAYPWLDHAVDTVKIRTAVVTAGVAPGSPECDAIERLVKAVRDHRAWLRLHGHPEWSEVATPSAEMLADPRLSPCAAKAYR